MVITQTELAVTKEQIRLQTMLDQFKDDLIDTLKELLEAKDNLITELRGKLNNEQ